MRKKAVVLALAAALAASSVAWAEIELGFGVSPPIGKTEKEGDPGPEGPLGDTILSFHAGYSFWWLFYLSADAYVVPPSFVKGATTAFDTEEGFTQEGIYRPGFLNMLDVGIRPRIGPIALMATVGVNQLYIYKEADLPKDMKKPSLGLNLRLGGHVFISKNLAVTLNGTLVFQDPEQMGKFFDAVGGSNEYLREQAIKYLRDNLYPTVGLTLVL